MANVNTITREAYLAAAKPLSVKVGDAPLIAVVKEFSTGSMGWSVSGKLVILVDGVPVTCQVGLNVTVIGSKPKE